MKILDFSSKIIVLRVIYARNRFSASPKRQNASLTIVLEKLCFYRNASVMRWIDFLRKITLRTMILEENPKFSYFRFNKKHSFPWIRDRETFSSFGNMRNRSSAWNFPQKYDFEGEISKFSIFASIHTSISLNQGQGSIFMLRECAQSIFRLEITLKSRFLEENRKIFFERHLVPPQPD